MLRTGKEYDGRRKLSDLERVHIRELYRGGKGVREISRVYHGKCSRRLIQFILFPDRLIVVQKRAIEVKRWQAGNVKEIHTPAMRKHRAKIKELHNRQLI